MNKWLVAMVMTAAFCIFSVSTAQDAETAAPEAVATPSQAVDEIALVKTVPVDTFRVKKRHPMTTADKIRAKRLHIELRADKGDIARQVLDRENEPFAGTDMEVRIDKVQNDEIGYTHVRLQQYYKGIPVDGATKIVHVNKDNVLYDVDGGFARKVDVDVTPKISAASAQEIALGDALNSECTDPRCGGWKTASRAKLDSTERMLAMRQKPALILRTPSLLIAGDKLIYDLIVREQGLDIADWRYWISASTGEVVRRFNTICYYKPLPPSSAGIDTAVKGVKIHREIVPGSNDSVVTLTKAWKVTSEGNYYLYSRGDATYGPWGIYNLNYKENPDSSDTASHWVRSRSPDYGTTDRVAISAAKNGELTQRYIADSLGRWSFDGNGKLLRLYVRIPDSLKYPLANYGTGDTAIRFMDTSVTYGYGPVTVLDLVSHEIGHAITHHTSNLTALAYIEDQALSESYSDIFAAAVGFTYQPDSSRKWPGAVPGTADWLTGEDAIKGFLAVMDFRYAQRTAAQRDTIQFHTASYYEGSGFESPDPNDPYDLYSNNYYFKEGVQNFAFYLLACGNDSLRVNDGHPYGIFGGIGVAGAARVAMKANMCYLSKHSSFQDSKNAWMKAAVDLVDVGKIPARSVAVVESAWVAVGVFPELRWYSLANTQPIMQVSRNGNLKLAGDSRASSLNVSGFRLSYKGQRQAILDQGGNLYYRASLTDSCGAYLDTASLRGSLAIRGPDGKMQWAIDGIGNIKARRREVWHRW